MQGFFEVVACWATGPDHSLRLYEGEPVHASEVDPQDFVGVVVRYYPKLLEEEVTALNSRRGVNHLKGPEFCFLEVLSLA